MRVVAFDVWGDYAHFKRNYTTTSPLSFPAPPKTTVLGLIAAIIGLEREEYPDVLKGCEVGIRLLKPIKRARLMLSLVGTKSEHLVSSPLVGYFKKHILIGYEFIKDPHYRIYLRADDWVLDTLKEQLIAHKCVYTPYLGLSELICNFGYVGCWECDEIKPTEHVPIDSIVPIESSTRTYVDKRSIRLRTGGVYSVSDSMPLSMGKDREVAEYIRVLVEESGGSIEARPNACVEVGDGSRVMLF